MSYDMHQFSKHELIGPVKITTNNNVTDTHTNYNGKSNSNSNSTIYANVASA